MMTRINVIDPDVRRRASVSREFYARDMHVETYDDVAEFRQNGPANGLMFVWDEPAGGLVDQIDQIRDTPHAAVAIVGYAENPAPDTVVAGMRAGAVDYLQWPFDRRLLADVCERVANGTDRLVQQELRRSWAKVTVQQLSGREAEVLNLLVRGLSNKETARVLGISPRTVEIHRANMMSKLGAQSSSEAVRIGIYAGLDEGLLRSEWPIVTKGGIA